MFPRSKIHLSVGIQAKTSFSGEWLLLKVHHEHGSASHYPTNQHFLKSLVAPVVISRSCAAPRKQLKIYLQELTLISRRPVQPASIRERGLSCQNDSINIEHGRCAKSHSTQPRWATRAGKSGHCRTTHRLEWDLEMVRRSGPLSWSSSAA
jgi:hypothetical protein